MAVQNFEIGLTYAGRVNVETLTTVPNMAPASFHFAYAETTPTGDNGAFALGSPRIEWRWAGTMPAAMFAGFFHGCSFCRRSVNSN